MKLSMWLVERRLPYERMWSNIPDGSRDICGVRLFTDNTEEFSGDYIYVEKARGTVAGPRDEVLLIHRNDTIVIPNQPVEDVLNAVLAVMDYYTAWERELLMAAARPGSLQDIVDLAGQVLNGPLCVADGGGRALASTSGDGPHRQDEGWRYFREVGAIPPRYASARLYDESDRVCSDWGERPALYRMEDRRFVSARLLSDGEAVASLYIQQFDKPLNRADVQLAEVLLEALSAMSFARGGNPEIGSCVSIVRALLEGREAKLHDLDRLNAYFGGKGPFRLLLFRSATENTDRMHFSSLSEGLRHLLLQSLSFGRENESVCILPDLPVGRLEDILSCGLVLGDYRIGLSEPFRDWEKAARALRQATFAAGEPEAEGAVCAFGTVALRCATEELRRLDDALGLRHPALDLLRTADARDGTAYYATLRAYLRRERNMAETARALSLHVNTMKYRLRRILEITGLDLNDADTRTLLLLSFRLEEEDGEKNAEKPQIFVEYAPERVYSK